MDSVSLRSRIRAREWEAIDKVRKISPDFILSLSILKTETVLTEFELAQYAIRRRPAGVSYLQAVFAVTGILRGKGELCQK